MKLIKESNAFYPLGGYQDILKKSRFTMIKCEEALC
jgi:hypothetical protein